MVTNLLGRRLEISDDEDLAADIRNEIGYVVAVDADDTGFWLLIELLKDGRLVTLETQYVTLSAA